MSEHDEQVALLQWAAWQVNLGRHELRWLAAWPNGGWRAPRTAALLKAEGVRPGIPDLFLPVPRAEFHGLWLEMKQAQGGTESPHQKLWAYVLRTQGYAVDLCHGSEAAIAAINYYLSLPKEQPYGSKQVSKQVRKQARPQLSPEDDPVLAELIRKSEDALARRRARRRRPPRRLANW